MRCHTGDLPYYCLQCDRGFDRPNVLKKHMQRHKAGKKLFKGLKCKQELNRYNYKRRNAGEMAYNCSQCSKGFDTPEKFRKHEMDHIRIPQSDIPSPDMPYSCLECNKKYDNKNSLRMHVKRKDWQKNQYEKQYLKENPFKCLECEKKFISASHLRFHMKNKHSERKKFCYNIDKKVRPYKCNKCDTRFTRRSNLNVHIRNHSGVKPFVCSECDKAYTTAWNLKLHLKKVHKGKRKETYTCDQCKECFANKGEHTITVTQGGLEEDILICQIIMGLGLFQDKDKN